MDMGRVGRQHSCSCPTTLPSRYPVLLQEKAEVVGDTPTMLHLMGQNNLLQRTGFRGGETELEDE